MNNSEITYSTIRELRRGLHLGELTPIELTEICLNRINQLDPALNAFVKLFPERAMREAEKLQKTGKQLGPLHGIPFAVKDLFDVEGEPTKAGTSSLDNNIALHDSTVVRKLKEAGMILIGKTHTSPLACEATGLNHDKGTPLNPWKKVPHMPGGSSSGFAVAVAAGMVPMALGTDTGGSVRIPSALCGLTGLKPTFGRVSRAGVYPLCWSYDSVGPLTRSVADAASVHDAMQGRDPLDETTLSVYQSGNIINIDSEIAGLRLAFAESVFFDDVDSEVETTVRGSKDVFSSKGALVSSIEIPEMTEANSMADRYLEMSVEACSVNNDLFEKHPNEIDVVMTWLLDGQEVTSQKYLELIRKRYELTQRVDERLQDVDALLVPTTQITAHPLGKVDGDAETYYQYMDKYSRNTSLGNYLKFCSISIYCGFSSEGLPIGLMIYAKSFDEEIALRVANAFESSTIWSSRHPDLAWAEKGT